MPCLHYTDFTVDFADAWHALFHLSVDQTFTVFQTVTAVQTFTVVTPYVFCD